MSGEAIYKRSEDPDEKPEPGSVTERIARLRKSLSGDKLARRPSGGSSGFVSALSRRAKDAGESLGMGNEGYADLDGERQLNSAERAERDLDQYNAKRAARKTAGDKAGWVRAADGSLQREETKSEPLQTKNGLYVSMDDGEPPPKAEDRVTRLRREGTQWLRRASKSVSSAAAQLTKRRASDPAEDPQACSGGGRVDAAEYVDKQQLDQFDRAEFSDVTSQLAAATTLAGASQGGLWALKARYIAANKVIPGKLAKARDAEVRAQQLADTLTEATDRCDELQAQANLLEALLEQARRLEAQDPPPDPLPRSPSAGSSKSSPGGAPVTPP
mmetsp:Transcript_26403/g.79174  ORF Transcript_26403/g.79174 Transcript_26403/m.79174 type:complete len:330 (+) Transcript_26403:291-1280(+)